MTIALLRRAWEEAVVVVTPHPRAYGLLADKRNLVRLSGPEALAALGVGATARDLLAASIPPTVLVTAAREPELWERRRELFFKPFTGYGSRGSYRGDKLTRRKWAEILGGGYVAQRLVPASERTVLVDGRAVPLKLDVRAYVYDRRIQLLAARLYGGQTTNFRTRGGGFAPVYVEPGRDCAVPG